MMFVFDHQREDLDGLHFLQTGELSIDTETTGLSEEDRLFCVTVSTCAHQFYFDKDFLHHLEPIANNPDVVWYLQNAKFDMRMLKDAGITLAGRIMDIGMMARVVRNDHMRYNLDAQAARAGMVKLTIAEEEIKEKKLYELRKTKLGEQVKQPRYDWVDRDMLKTYACHDAKITYDLAKLHESQLYATHGDARAVVLNESDLTKVCFAMERRGVGIDIDYTKKARAFSIKQHSYHVERFTRMTGVEYVDSAKTFEPLFRAKGLPISTTEKGNPTFAAEALEDYDDDLARCILDIRGEQKLTSTYYDNFINMEYKGRIHPSMHQYGTTTGRFSYSDPNLQNLPKDDKDSADEFVVRGCFRPKPGHAFVAIDYVTFEYMLMLAYANEKKLINLVMNHGVDIHQATGDLLGIPRQRAKTLNFAILYGSGIDLIAKYLGVPRAEAQRIKLHYFMELPYVERFIDTVIRTGRARGYVYNWLGRRLYADRDFAYKLPNYLIQGGTADIVKVAMNKIGVDAPMILQIHDELIFEVPATQMERIGGWQKIMESVYPETNGVRMRTEASFSTRSLAKRDMEKIP